MISIHDLMVLILQGALVVAVALLIYALIELVRILTAIRHLVHRMDTLTDVRGWLNIFGQWFGSRKKCRKSED